MCGATPSSAIFRSSGTTTGKLDASERNGVQRLTFSTNESPISGWKFRRKAMNDLLDSLFPKAYPDSCSGLTLSLAVLFATQSEETTKRHDGGTDDEVF